MNKKFKIGDIVILKGESPKMTIINDKLGDDPEKGFIFNAMYKCAWFNERTEYKEIFPEEVLVLVV